MSAFTLHDLQCFDAVVREGSFQAAAAAQHRSHPAVFSAVARLERQLGVALLDRSGYRVRPTEAGMSLHRQVQSLLREAQSLRVHAQQLAMGEETQLRIVIGDLCPRPEVLELLGRFFASCPRTRLHLHYEAITGPIERLFDNEADLIIHRVDASDERLDALVLGIIRLVPVVAPGFLPFPVTGAITHEQMRQLTQCVIRDTARHSPDYSSLIVEGAHQCTVTDHAMKKEVIMQGMAWGHLPHFMIEQELRDGRLLDITGRYFPGVTETLVAARRRDIPLGPVAARLWQHMAEGARELQSVIKPGRAVGAKKRRPLR